MRGRPFRHGPHWPADSAARYPVTRAASVRPHRSDGSAASTPAPAAAPNRPSDALSSVIPAASGSGSQVPW